MKNSDIILASRKEGSRVVWRNGLIKKYHPYNFEAELQKHRLVEEALCGSGIVFPSLVANDGLEWISMEDLGDLISLRDIYLNHMIVAEKIDDMAPALMSQAGTALALIHAIDPKTVPATLCHQNQTGMKDFTIGNQIGKFEDVVILHGDYGFSNVMMQRNTKKLVIIDPSANHFTTSHPIEQGSPLLDLGHFTSCLIGLVPPQNFPMMKWHRAAGLINNFLLGYESSSGRQIDRSHLMSVAEHIAKAYFAYKYSSGIMRTLSNALFKNRRKKIETDLFRLQR